MWQEVDFVCPGCGITCKTMMYDGDCVRDQWLRNKECLECLVNKLNK